MKNIFKTLSVIFVTLSLIACTKEPHKSDNELPVTSDNISGTWELSEISGEPLADGLFMYLELVRRDKVFSFYENISGSHNVTVHKSGHFDFFGERVISFLYDNSISSYGKRYEIISLTEDKMVWVREDNRDEVSVYVRCESIPELPGISDNK